MARTAGPAHVVAGAGARTGASAADVELDARVAARELRADTRPRTRSRVFGPDARQDEVSTRRNLPERLVPGRVERDIAVRRRVAARLRSRWGVD